MSYLDTTHTRAVQITDTVQVSAWSQPINQNATLVPHAPETNFRQHAGCRMSRLDEPYCCWVCTFIIRHFKREALLKAKEKRDIVLSYLRVILCIWFRAFVVDGLAMYFIYHTYNVLSSSGVESNTAVEVVACRLSY